MVSVSIFGGATIHTNHQVSIYGPAPSTRTAIFGAIPLVPYSNIYGALPYGNSGNSPATVPTTIQPNQLTLVQYNALRTIYTQYSSKLATKQFDSILSSTQQCTLLSNVVQTIQITDPVLQLIINIISHVLLASSLANNLYLKYVDNQNSIHDLQFSIDDTLSSLNQIHTSVGSDQIQLTKQFKLSPIFGSYVYLYGLPEFGVGFDPVKLAELEAVFGTTL